MLPVVAELPERVDLAVVSVPAEGARDAIREFVENGEDPLDDPDPGRIRRDRQGELEEQIIAIARRWPECPDGGPVLVGGNCLGIVSKRQYNTFFLPQYKLPFHDAPGDNLAAISQSGAYLVTLASNLDGVIFPKASISYGNQMDLTVSDFLEHYLDDRASAGSRLLCRGIPAARRPALRRPRPGHRARGRAVIVFKAGKTPLGAKAAASHTASLAGDYVVATRLADRGRRDRGRDAQPVRGLHEGLHDALRPGARGAEGRVISNAGFECSTAMDALSDLGRRFSQRTRAAARVESCRRSRTRTTRST